MLKNILVKAWLAISVFFAHAAVAAPAVVEEEHPVVILGGGIAALTSAIYLSRAGITPVVITGPTVGGAITQSHSVQNWPGEMEITGVELSERVKAQAIQNGADLRSETVIDIDLTSRPFVITTKEIYETGEKVKKIKAQACIIALGAELKRLGVPGEYGIGGYWSRGVYSCAVCDGGIYKDKVVAVVGGGDSALTEAHYLSNIAAKVYVIVRGSSFRSVEQERMRDILSRPNIEVVYQSEVKQIKGDGQRVTHIDVQNNEGNKFKQISVDAVFLAIGSEPNTALFRGQLELDKQGYIALKNYQETSIPGVYAVGDIADPEFKQAVSAAGDASKAALQAQKRLTQIPPQKMIAKVPGPAAEPVIEIHSNQELKEMLSRAEGVVILDFYGDYCGPCRMFAPLYESWAKQYEGKAIFAKVNVSNARELFDIYQVHSIPTLIILDKEGKVIRKGAGSPEISEVGKRLENARDMTSIDAAAFR